MDWALQLLWDRPEVSVVLSGMRSRQQVVENCASADRSGVNSLTPNDPVMFQEIAGVLRRGMLVQCTGCGYCEPCPAGVSIPCNFALANNMVAGSSSVMDIVFRLQIKRNYKGLAQSKEERERTGKEGSSLLCVECGACIPKCTQSINIPEELKVNEVISKQKITVKEIFQMLLYTARNWRLVLSRVMRRGSS